MIRTVVCDVPTWSSKENAKLTSFFLIGNCFAIASSKIKTKNWLHTQWNCAYKQQYSYSNKIPHPKPKDTKFSGKKNKKCQLHHNKKESHHILFLFHFIA